MDSSLDFHSHGSNLFIGAGVPQRGGVVSTVSWKPLGLLSLLLLLFLVLNPDWNHKANR